MCSSTVKKHSRPFCSEARWKSTTTYRQATKLCGYFPFDIKEATDKTHFQELATTSPKKGVSSASLRKKNLFRLLQSTSKEHHPSNSHRVQGNPSQRLKTLKRIFSIFTQVKQPVSLGHLHLSPPAVLRRCRRSQQAELPRRDAWLESIFLPTFAHLCLRTLTNSKLVNRKSYY